MRYCSILLHRIVNYSKLPYTATYDYIIISIYNYMHLYTTTYNHISRFCCSYHLPAGYWNRSAQKLEEPLHGGAAKLPMHFLSFLQHRGYTIISNKTLLIWLLPRFCLKMIERSLAWFKVYSVIQQFYSHCNTPGWNTNAIVTAWDCSSPQDDLYGAAAVSVYDPEDPKILILLTPNYRCGFRASRV